MLKLRQGVKTESVARRAGGTLLACVIGGCLALRIYPLIIFNYAQLERLHGRVEPALFDEAVQLAPQDSHIRWQAGAGLAAGGDLAAAARILQPLAQEKELDPNLGQLMVGTFVRAGQADAATQLYQNLSPKPDLPAGIAAQLVENYLQHTQQAPITGPPTSDFLALALGTKPAAPEFQVITPRLADPGFWATAVGQRTANALQWQDRDGRQQEGAQPLESAAPERLSTSASLLASQGTSVAALLKIPGAAVQLGPNLAVNGNFERRDPQEEVPQGWVRSSMTTGNPWNRALFVIGLDSAAPYQGRSAVRIDGLQIEHVASRETARAGIWHGPITLQSGQPYVISFVYRTAGALSPTAGLWLSADPQVLWAGERFLPNAPGGWQRVTIIAWNRRDQAADIAPLLRAWGEGSVWFADFSVRALTVSVPAPPQDPLIQIANAQDK